MLHTTLTHPEGAEERRGVQRPLLAKGAREHVSSTMAETAGAGTLVTHGTRRSLVLTRYVVELVSARNTSALFTGWYNLNRFWWLSASVRLMSGRYR